MAFKLKLFKHVKTIGLGSASLGSASISSVSLGSVIGFALVVAMGCGAGQTAMAKDAAPSAADPALEARVMAISEELRCLVCQNETIAASHADLAVDLRKQIRLKLVQGQSQQQILDFMVERYGDFVLYRPPLKTSTVLLWIGPFALLVGAALVLFANVRRRRASEQPMPLSAEEVLQAQQLLGGDALRQKSS